MWGGSGSLFLSRWLCGYMWISQIAHGAPLQRHPRQSPQHFTNGSGVKLKATKPLAFTSSPEDGHLGTRDASARAAVTCVLPTARSAGVTSLHRQLYNSNAVL